MNEAGQNSVSSSAWPFLEGWKTSVGLFILGLICSAVLGYGVEFMAASENPAYITVALVIGICYLVFVIAYALAIYPSLFGEHPKLKSNGAVSFLNAFTGWVIIGALWCSCLKRKRKGVSQYVLVVFFVVTMVGSFAVGMMEGAGSTGPAPSRNTTAATNAASGTNTSTAMGGIPSGTVNLDQSFLGAYNVIGVGVEEENGEIQFYSTEGSVNANENRIIIDFGSESSMPVHVEGSAPKMGDGVITYGITGESGLDVIGFEGVFKYCCIGEIDGTALVVLAKNLEASEEGYLPILIEKR